jgi:3-oxoadipate enol-lactonase
VLLHGWTATAALNWSPSFGPLADHFRVVALDHRGHGHGIRSWRRFTLEDCADDAVALLDALEVDSAIPVGYSMGGPIAQLMWQRHRDRVDGLVLCATAARFRDRGDRALQGVVTGLSLAVRAAPGWMHKRVTERLVVNRYDTSPLGTWAREQARLNDLRPMIEAGHAVGSYDARSWLGGVDVPTGVVLTTYDTTVPPARQQAMADMVPGARVFPVNGSHDVCAVDPAEFVSAVVAACTDGAGRAESRHRHAG